MFKMKLQGMLPFRTVLLCLSLAIMSTYASGPDSGLTQEYCSDENTGGDYNAVYNTYNSNGACYTQCKDEYAFAVVQDKQCWCSNYIPAEQQSVANCNLPCPGYPSELCGNLNSGLYGYIKLPNAPAGTAGANGQTSSPSPTYSTFSSYIPSSISSSSTMKAVTTIRVTTVSGAVVTETVTTTPLIVAPSNGADAQSLQRHGLSRGAVAGIVIGALLGLAAVFVGAFLLWLRKKNDDTEGGATVKKPKRGGSVLSRTGLLGGARPQSMSEHAYEEPYYNMNQATRSNSVRHSTLFGASVVGDGVSPVSPLGGSQDNVNVNADSRRHSKLRVYDQRLNPSALFANHDNGSRVSMQDQQDYSRPLGIVNPDMRHSFDSR